MSQATGGRHQLRAGRIAGIHDRNEGDAGRRQIQGTRGNGLACKRRKVVARAKPELLAVQSNARVGEIVCRQAIAACRHAKVKEAGMVAIGIDGKERDAARSAAQAMCVKMQSRHR